MTNHHLLSTHKHTALQQSLHRQARNMMCCYRRKPAKGPVAGQTRVACLALHTTFSATGAVVEGRATTYKGDDVQRLEVWYARCELWEELTRRRSSSEHFERAITVL